MSPLLSRLREEKEAKLNGGIYLGNACKVLMCHLSLPKSCAYSTTGVFRTGDT